MDGTQQHSPILLKGSNECSERIECRAMRQTPRRLGICLAAILFWAGCASGPEFGSSHDPLEAFPQSGLWVWDEPAIELPKDERLSSLALGPVLEEAIEAELEKRGYRKGTSKAHYRVSAHLTVGTRVRPEESLAIGSLTLILRKPGSERPVWAGYARTEVDVAVPPAERRDRLRAIVARMLEPFPPGSDR